MISESSDAELARIEVALTRLESSVRLAAAADSRQPSGQDAADLAHRHQQLRAAVSATLGTLDALIADAT